MAKRSKAQEDALKALGNPKVNLEYDDGSIDFEYEGQKLAMGPNGSVMTPAEYMTKVYRPWQEKKKKKPKEKEEPPIPSWAVVSKTPCEREPELCEPRVIKHVAWDADDTIWDIKPYGIASNITGPLRLVDPDTVVEERPAYKPPAQTTAFQAPLPSEGEVQSYKYGHRYGHSFGYPAEEEPEDFFLRQIDKDIEKKKPGNPTSHKPVADIEELKTIILDEITNRPEDIVTVDDLTRKIISEGFESPLFNDILDTAFELLEEGHITYVHSQGQQAWKLGRDDEYFEDEEEKPESAQPSETALEVSQIMTELTDELTPAEKDKLRLFSDKAKLPTEAEVPPKEPGKKKKSTFGEPTKIYIKLMPGYRDLLDTLKKQGVTNSIISLNTKGTVSRIIETFGLTDHYLDIRDSWDNKGKVFNEQMKTFGYKPQEAMFVDNTQSHVEDVAKSGAVPLVYGKDIKEVAQIVNYMTNA